jgi:hypothetical protein
MDNYIKELYLKGIVSRHEALANVHNLVEFDQLMRSSTSKEAPLKR